ncbi:MAG TPA: hypothetical protein VEQ60_04130 [Longimicrobium sp.]|nr:hypothetical protein [Longimicrobium sp.]
MEITSAVDARTAANLDPGIGTPLPALVMGERAETTRKHEWPGRLFILLSGGAALGMAAVALLTAVWGLNGDANLALGAGGGVMAVLQWRLTKEVSRFSRWGWYGAMVELGAATAAKVWTMAEGNLVGGAIGLCIDVMWMRYFWKRRAQFDIDLGG